MPNSRSAELTGNPCRVLTDIDAQWGEVVEMIEDMKASISRGDLNVEVIGTEDLKIVTDSLDAVLREYNDSLVGMRALVNEVRAAGWHGLVKVVAAVLKVVLRKFRLDLQVY